MNTQDRSKGSKDQEYLSKRVLVNGQFVTLYSINGQTWLSSPEEIPELMARLENARIMLANPEKQEGEAQQPKPAQTDAQAPKVAQNKYRMKGPKPRPILKQGGVVIKGTPVEPISASGTLMSFSHDQEMADQSSASAKRGARKSKVAGKAKNTPPKHIAPVLAAPGKVKKVAVTEKPVVKTASAKSAGAAKAAPVKPVATKAVTAAKVASDKKLAASERKSLPVVKAAKAKPPKSVAKAKGKKAKASSKKKKSSR